MQPIIDHIQITVKNMALAEPFYDQLMPILGFDLAKKHKGKVPAHELEVIEYVHPLLLFAINSPRSVFEHETVNRRKPGALHHLAFKVDSCKEVDDAYQKIKAIGATVVDVPKYYPQHGEKYYALFFKDPDGIKYEIVYDDGVR